MAKSRAKYPSSPAIKLSAEFPMRGNHNGLWYKTKSDCLNTWHKAHHQSGQIEPWVKSQNSIFLKDGWVKTSKYVWLKGSLFLVIIVNGLQSHTHFLLLPVHHGHVLPQGSSIL